MLRKLTTLIIVILNFEDYRISPVLFLFCAFNYYGCLIIFVAFRTDIYLLCQQMRSHPFSNSSFIRLICLFPVFDQF